MFRLLFMLLLVAFVAKVGLGALDAAGGEDGRVVRVIDGDTLVVRTGGREETVRLLGIDTPERGDCGFDAATEALERAVARGRVTLVADGSQDERDRYGRLLAYVDTRGGGDAGEAVVRRGWAAVYVFDRPFARVERYRSAFRAARAAGRGLVAACGGA